MNEVAPRLGLGIGPDGTYTRAGQTVAFILGLLTMVVFFPFMILAALLYTAAENRFAGDPRGARTLITWSWLSITAMPAAVAALAAGLFAVLA